MPVMIWGKLLNFSEPVCPPCGVGIKIMLRGPSGSPQSMVPRCGSRREGFGNRNGFKEEIIAYPMATF